MSEDIIRVIRIIQYEGPRSKVEKQVANSLHGGPKDYGNGVKIIAVTLGEWPDIIGRDEEVARLRRALQQIADDPCLDPEGNAGIAQAALVGSHK